MAISGTGSSPPGFDAVVERIVAVGVPEAWVWGYAHGILFSLARCCAENYSDVVGSALDVETCLRWKGQRGALAGALLDCGLLRRVSGSVLCCPVALHYMSEAQVKQWRRRDQESYEAAMLRKRDPPAMPAPESAAEMHPEPDALDPPTNLFGDEEPPPKPKPTRPARPPGHHEVVDHYAAAWHRRYGSRYPFSPKDFAHVASILRAVDADSARRCIDAYLASTDRFYAGHPISKLLGSLPIFLAAANGGSRDGGGLPYAGEGESLGHSV